MANTSGTNFQMKNYFSLQKCQMFIKLQQIILQICVYEYMQGAGPIKRMLIMLP